MAKKITIIGGSGFVGTNLCRALALKQQDFEILDLKLSNEFEDKCKIADVRDPQSLRASITGDVVINLAAVHRDDVQDKSQYQRTNVDGAANVATVCADLGINKIVFTSSVAVYGFATPGTDENGEIKPFNEYGRTKYEAEKRLINWYEEGNRKLIIVRPTVIFGEGNRGNVYNLFKQISSGVFVMIGDGKNKKSMAYIGNVVEFLIQCIQSEEDFKVYNYIDTPDLTINELVSIARRTLHDKKGPGFHLPYIIGLLAGYIADGISKVTGKRLPISSIRVKKFKSTTEFKSNKQELDGFMPPYSLQEGIHNTLHCEFISPNPNREIFFTE